MFSISGLKFDSRAILAPMEAVNCTAFRLQCRKHGAAYVVSQMYDADKFIIASQKQKELFATHYVDFTREEQPLSVQFSANKATTLKQAIETLESSTDRFSMIDLNFGCPLSEQLAKKAGSYFMKHIDQMAKLVSHVTSYTQKPITAKIRLGWDEKTLTYLEAAKVLEDAGINAVALHPRTRIQRYRDNADMKHIKALVEQVSIPVIGNGDITLPGHAKAMLERTGCAAVMIGRGARGNPFIFSQINHLLATGKNLPADETPDYIEQFTEFLDLYTHGQKRQSFSEVQDHARWFCSGAPQATALRSRIDAVKTIPELLDVIKNKK